MKEFVNIMPNIVFDETHNERVMLRTWTHLQDLFQTYEIDVAQYTDFPITADKIESADLFVFGCPDGSKLYEYEIKTLVKYVEKGGSLLVLGHSGGDRGLMSNMNLLLENFNIELMSNQIIDNVDCWENNIPTHVLIKNFEQHPAVEGINTFCYISGCSLVVDPPAKAIAFSGYHAETPNKPIIAVTTHNQGKVGAIGCHRSFSGYRAGISLYDNSKLLVQIVKWLLDKEKDSSVSSSPSIASKATSSSMLSISSNSSKAVPRRVVASNQQPQLAASKQPSSPLRSIQTPVRKIQPKTTKIKRISPNTSSVVKIPRSQPSTSKPSSPPSSAVLVPPVNQDVSTLKSDVQALHQVVNEIKSELHSLKEQTTQKMDEMMKELKVLGSVLRLKEL